MHELIHLASHDVPRAIEIASLLLGMFYMGRELRADARSRQIENLIHITEGHRELWNLLYTHPELVRVLSPAPDFRKKPITTKEDRFVRALINHLNVSFQASRFGLLRPPGNLRTEVAEFFRLPIPGRVWTRVRVFHDKRFVKFVDGCLRRRARRAK